jgi:hypothetical protein
MRENYLKPAGGNYGLTKTPPLPNTLVIAIVRGTTWFGGTTGESRPVFKEQQQSMPKRFESPILVPTPVLDGLETVRESAPGMNMLDPQAVQAIAESLGYPEAVAWIENHPDEYQEGIFRGFVADG